MARLGGDEFSVILPKTDAVQAKLIMDRITGSADKESLKSIVISVAAGYATKTSPDQNIDEIIKIAENNMYSDKINTGSLDGEVDILVNNAGVVTQHRTETVDGFEMMLGTNMLGPFALTNLLLGRVRSRIINVGSDAHRS